MLTLVTHRALPEGAPDDRLLAQALRERGAAVRFAVWDDPDADWGATPLAIVRSTWDYYHDPARWLAWVDGAGAATALVNPPDLLRWNSDKRYLLALAEAGVPCIPTAVLEPAGDAAHRPSPESLPAIAASRGWGDVVVKPAVAASAFGARRFAGGALALEGEQHLRDLVVRGAVIVQPYLPSVERSRERSLVFVEGAFVHAYTKPAFSTITTGAAPVESHHPSADELAVAVAALEAAPGGCAAALYARVDLVPDQGGPLLMELELIEPDLALRLCPDATVRLAEACLARVARAASASRAGMR